MLQSLTPEERMISFSPREVFVSSRTGEVGLADDFY